MTSNPHSFDKCQLTVIDEVRREKSMKTYQPAFLRLLKARKKRGKHI